MKVQKNFQQTVLRGNRMNGKIEELRQFLNSYPAGEIKDQSELITLLESSWNQLEGNEE